MGIVRTVFKEGGDVAAVLMFCPQLLGRTRRPGADSFPHRLIVADAFTKRARADDLLFGWRKLLEGQAGFTAQFAHRALQHHVKVFADKPEIALRQLKHIVDAHRVQLRAQTTAYAPHGINR